MAALSEGCTELINAFRDRDPDRVDELLPQVAAAARQAGADEVQDALARLTRVLADVSYGIGGEVVQLAGVLADRAPDPSVLLPALVYRVTEVMEDAAQFAAVWGESLGDPLTVLHRPTGRGYRVVISGIGDNFQLHTLLAARLIGDEARGFLPGERPSAVEIAAATDGPDLTPADGITGVFNLVDRFGDWIWNEGRPADIPRLEGERVVVLDPPPYLRSWNAGRVYPLMRPSLEVQRVLAAGEAERWLGLVKPPIPQVPTAVAVFPATSPSGPSPNATTTSCTGPSSAAAATSPPLAPRVPGG